MGWAGGLINTNPFYHLTISITWKRRGIKYSQASTGIYDQFAKEIFLLQYF